MYKNKEDFGTKCINIILIAFLILLGTVISGMIRNYFIELGRRTYEMQVHSITILNIIKMFSFLGAGVLLRKMTIKDVYIFKNQRLANIICILLVIAYIAIEVFFISMYLFEVSPNIEYFSTTISDILLFAVESTTNNAGVFLLVGFLMNFGQNKDFDEDIYL